MYVCMYDSVITMYVLYRWRMFRRPIIAKIHNHNAVTHNHNAVTHNINAVTHNHITVQVASGSPSFKLNNRRLQNSTPKQLNSVQVSS